MIPRRLSCQISANQREAKTNANVNKHWKTRAKGNDVIISVISANQHFAKTNRVRFLRLRYAWTIAECGQCGNHLGWRFTSVKRGLNPSKFWGLTRASLRPTLVYEEESHPENKRTPAAPPSPWRAVRICYTTSLGAWQSVSLHHPTEVRHSSENVWNKKLKAPSRSSCNAKRFFALDKREICLKI